VAFAAGKMLIGLDSSDTDFDTVEETGGAKTHTLTASEIPDHNHVYKYLAGQGSGSGVNFAGSSTALAHTWTATTDETVSTSTNHSLDTAGIAAGTYPGGSAHSIMNPYIAVYMWKRTA
jgi:microcystin-dependent protein